MKIEKRYRGDGVYAEFDGDSIIITTENGLGTTNKIYIESAVYEALEQFSADITLMLLEKEPA